MRSRTRANQSPATTRFLGPIVAVDFGDLTTVSGAVRNATCREKSRGRTSSGEHRLHAPERLLGQMAFDRMALRHLAGRRDLALAQVSRDLRFMAAARLERAALGRREGGRNLAFENDVALLDR